jgi:hypothetical protein
MPARIHLDESIGDSLWRIGNQILGLILALLGSAFIYVGLNRQINQADTLLHLVGGVAVFGFGAAYFYDHRRKK